MVSPLDAVRRLSAASVNLLLSRAEFASVELAQARAQWMRWLLLALAVLLLGLLGLGAATALFVYALWPALGWVGLLLPSVGYVAAAGFVLYRLRDEIAASPPLLSQTLRELARDRDAFLARPSDAAPSGSAAERDSP